MGLVINSDGIWVKTSRDIGGWNSIIGPDILKIKNNNVVANFFHSDLTYDYHILNSYLFLENDSADNSQGILVDFHGNNLLSLSGDGYSFWYFRIVEPNYQITYEKVFMEMPSKRYIDENRTIYFEFLESIDLNTDEKLLKYKTHDVEKSGKWSIHLVDNYVLLELNLIQEAERRLIIINEISNMMLSGYYIKEDGTRIKLEFWK